MKISFLKNNINKKTKTLLYMIAALNMIVLLFGAFVFYTVYKKYGTVAELYEKVRIIEKRQDEMIYTERLILSTEEDINKLNSYFVDSDNVVDFIKDIEYLGTNADVLLVLNSVNISGEENGLLSLEFTTEGSWGDSMYLLALLESMPVKMDVNKVNFVKRKTTDDSYWQGEFNVTLLSFLNN